MQHKLPFLVESPVDDPSAPPLRRPSGRERHIVLAGRIVSYYFRRSTRRTIGLAIDDRGLQAAAPAWTSIAEVEAFIREKERWVLQHLQTRRSRRPQFLWHDGARLQYLGREIIVRYSALRQNVELVGDRLETGLDEPFSPMVMRATVLAWIKREALALYRTRIDTLAAQFDVAAPQVGLSQARTQWGSCTRKRDGSARILLNWKLIHFELPLIDYVAAHELAHLRHMNHSAAFWREVARVYPEYRAARAALRERGHLIPEL